LALFCLALAGPCLHAFPAQAPAPQKPAPDPAGDPVWDPLRAEKDIEVGRYYMKKGDFDAAIDRFQDATVARPGYALPFRLLAEAQEKKGLKREAIQSYKTYLKIFPHAQDAGPIRKRIQKLEQELPRPAKRKSN
jgi:tetratricopeptide (TPR) repeat protein